MAGTMGIREFSFLAASNENDVVPDFLRSGRFAPRASIPTISSAMDVGHPSNFHRILHLFRGDQERLRRKLAGEKVTDMATLGCIQRTYRQTGYVLDPHSAVALAALERKVGEKPDGIGVVLATAHPAKVAEVVEPALGITLPIPPELSRCLEARRQVVSMEPRVEALQELLRG
jgi:threonine synthase